MNVNFTGMQNVGRSSIPNQSEFDSSCEKFSIQLNNRDEKDLDSFKKVLKDYPDFTNSNFLNIEFGSVPNRRDPLNPDYDVYINSKQLELTDENLPVFSKIINLFKRISNGEANTPVLDEYLESTACRQKFLYELSKQPFKKGLETLENIHNPQNVREGGEDILKKLTKSVSEHCISGPKTFFSGIKNVAGFTIQAKDGDFSQLYLDLKEEDMAQFKDFSNIEDSKAPRNRLLLQLGTKEETGKSEFRINHNEIILNEKNILPLKKLTELLGKISVSDKDLPLAYELPAPISRTNLKKVYGEDVEFTESDSDIKAMAKRFINTIDGQIESYFD